MATNTNTTSARPALLPFIVAALVGMSPLFALIGGAL